MLPPQARPPHQITRDTKEEAHAALDEILEGITAHTIYLPKKLGEDFTAKATENDTTLSRVVEPMLEAWVQEDRPSTEAAPADATAPVVDTSPIAAALDLLADALEDIEGEWGARRSVEELRAAGDQDTLTLDAARAALRNIESRAGA